MINSKSILEGYEERHIITFHYRSWDINSSLVSSVPAETQSSPVTLGGGEWVVNCPPPGTEANVSVMVTSTTACPVGSESLTKLSVNHSSICIQLLV